MDLKVKTGEKSRLEVNEKMWTKLKVFQVTQSQIFKEVQQINICKKINNTFVNLTKNTSNQSLIEKIWKLSVFICLKRI